MTTMIKNFTPHSLNFFAPDSVRFDSAIRKNVAAEGAAPVASLPSLGMLSAKIETVADGSLGGILVFAKQVTGCDPLPEGGIVVVSALYAMAAAKMGMDMTRIYTVADPVFSEDGRTVLGCLGICPAF